MPREMTVEGAEAAGKTAARLGWSRIPPASCDTLELKAAYRRGYDSGKDTTKRCFACGKPLKGARYFADCADDQKGVEVGPDCYQRIFDKSESARANGVKNTGYVPPKGGPALFPTGEA